jgi:hypothetical protein
MPYAKVEEATGAEIEEHHIRFEFAAGYDAA